MKIAKVCTTIFIVGFGFYFLGIILEDYPSLNGVFPYILIMILYVRYEVKIENLSMDLLSVEDQLEAVSKGEWEPNMRFRGNPFSPT